jgi:outer membrane protein TolC
MSAMNVSIQNFSLFSVAAFVAGVLVPILGFSQNQVLTEQKILSLYRENSVVHKAAQAQKASGDLQKSLLDEMYSPRLQAQLGLSRSGERAPNQFQPVISPAEQWSVGIQQKLSLGTTLSASVFGSQNSVDGSFREATQVGAKAEIQVDLWRNIFGQLDRAQLGSAQAQKQKAQFQFLIQQKKNESELRKLYWSLMASDQSRKLSEELLKSAEAQLKDALDRSRAGVADRGEVARTRSLVEGRKANLLLFEYEREVLMQAFEKQLTGFRGSEWVLDSQKAFSSEKIVGQCLVQIRTQAAMNLDHTDLDEWIEQIQKETEAELSIADRHSSADLQLVASLQTTGVGNSYSSSQDNLSDERKTGQSVGLVWTMPLGGASKKSEAALLQLKQTSLRAQSESLTNELESTYRTMRKALELLQRGLQNQEKTTESLSQSFQDTNRKFQQGRIPISTLIYEQDALFQSRLQEITFKKQISHVLLDYFAVFNKYPCAWNLLQGQE